MRHAWSRQAYLLKMDAIVLAAGMSRRMGQLKSLLPFGGGTVLGHVVAMLRAAPVVSSIIIVTGNRADEIEAALQGDGVRCVWNADFATGEMLSSVQCGVRALSPKPPAWLLMPGDLPLVQSRTVEELCAMWERTCASLVVPSHGERRGHPVLFSGSLREDVLALGPQETLRTVVQRERAVGNVVEVAVADAGIHLDLDTLEDYERALQIWNSAQSQGT
ncbi:MAG: molybdenum cofactor cytidylyltransferase [Abditibacteriota bacterium]|nr:molybdenum cofactor cytidylyltransferase [Abditibacteriota bacterium]